MHFSHRIASGKRSYLEKFHFATPSPNCFYLDICTIYISLCLAISSGSFHNEKYLIPFLFNAHLWTNFLFYSTIVQRTYHYLVCFLTYITQFSSNSFRGTAIPWQILFCDTTSNQPFSHWILYLHHSISLCLTDTSASYLNQKIFDTVFIQSSFVNQLSLLYYFLLWFVRISFVF